MTSQVKKFKLVDPKMDFIKMEKDHLTNWYSSGLVSRYLHKNDNSKTKFSFLDGPITANNPMGVHHAWGRTYKDLWQRFHNMKGDAGRFQNGFDCQGLWVEVEVEKELGFKSKKDIETYGVANFVNKCKDRVKKYSGIQTEQSKRLGYFCDWDNSYFTMSDENNYAIWNFLQVCYKRGWIYKGHDSVPWCPRCETAISQHEILTEDYKELIHKSIFFRLPIENKENEYLLVWTTTPWTLPANIAVAVDVNLDYVLYSDPDGKNYWVVAGKERGSVIKTVKGKDLVGLKYSAAFDDLNEVKKVSGENGFHTVIATDPMLMPISTEEGTGMVHTAVSAGEEDFNLGKKLGLPMIPVIADNADYLPTMDYLSGKNAKNNPEIILDLMESRGFTKEILQYKHRYPACWRCKTELVWKVADEWYIKMDSPDDTGKTLREQLIDVTKKITWLPSFGLDRELDWLKNMHDWLISKKNRYWGLALPIYECQKCGHFEIIGSKDELKTRAVAGWDKFEGNSPHKPWVDEVKIKCEKCGEEVSRIADVGNPWLDAGIVSISTMSADWFPADFITESFPGQFKNWFYSLIVMGTVLKKTNAFKTVLGYGSLLAEDGRPMHKSWGNSIEFNEGADKIGVDVMRWLYARANPTDNLLFGYTKSDEVRRRFYLMLWNCYSFFVTYANLHEWKQCESAQILDQWILARLNEVIRKVTINLDQFNAMLASEAIEEFVGDFSTWYIRRSRDRMTDEFFSTSYEVLVTLSKLLAPFMPFIAEEIYQNLTGEESVHLTAWPDGGDFDQKLIEEMAMARKVCEMGHAQRKLNSMKVRQPLAKVSILNFKFQLEVGMIQLIKDELNVKDVEVKNGDGELAVELDLKVTDELKEEGEAREVARSIQQARKDAGCGLNDLVVVELASWPKNWEDWIKKETLVKELRCGESLKILTG